METPITHIFSIGYYMEIHDTNGSVSKQPQRCSIYCSSFAEAQDLHRNFMSIVDVSGCSPQKEQLRPRVLGAKYEYVIQDVSSIHSLFTK